MTINEYQLQFMVQDSWSGKEKRKKDEDLINITGKGINNQ